MAILAFIIGGVLGFMLAGLCAAAGRDSDDIFGAPEGADFRSVARRDAENAASFAAADTRTGEIL